MNNVIGLCGAHGTGKSTILRAVKEKGFRVSEAQLSRTAQKMLGWDSLSRAQESESNMWALQDAILAALYDRDQEIAASGKMTLVDRTPADVWGYTLLWATRLDMKVDLDRLRQYKGQCRELAARYTRHLIVPIREEIAFVAEANRADLESREFHSNAVNDFVIGGGLRHSIIQTLNIEYRAAEAIIWLAMEHSRTQE